jgi:hypothetical protein
MPNLRNTCETVYGRHGNIRPYARQDSLCNGTVAGQNLPARSSKSHPIPNIKYRLQTKQMDRYGLHIKRSFYYVDVKVTVNASGVLINKPLIANYQSIYLKIQSTTCFSPVDHLQVLSKYKMYHYIVT